MTVTIHPQRGQRLTDLVRELIDLAGGDRRAVTAGRGGVIVGDTVALAYLTRHHTYAVDTITAPVDGDVAPRMAVPSNLNRLVQRAEQGGGLHQPIAAPPPPAEPAPAETPTTARVVPRKKPPRVRTPQPKTEAVNV